MSNIYPSILEKFTALNIDIFRHEDIARCYDLAKLNIEHSRKPDYADGPMEPQQYFTCSDHDCLP